MAQIRVNDLTFAYEGSFDNIFEHATFSIDTNWKLGFIGRNGKGKTTFLRLLSENGNYTYTGTIDSPAVFDYFPYPISPKDRTLPASAFAETLKSGVEEWQIICELNLLNTDPEVLYRPFSTLSFGEQTKVMLAILFSRENDFLLIDEPTNHLDQKGRDSVKTYLSGKKGFILVSHDRDLLDACTDHVLVLNRQTIEVQSGNFSSWQENKRKKDQFAQAENEKHQKEIAKLKSAAGQAKRWADKSEASKIGFDPIKDPGHGRKRAYIGAKTKKMQSRVKQIEKRIEQEISQKEGLLNDIETPVPLKIMPLTHEKKILVSAENYGFQYPGAKAPLFQGLNFTVQTGDRIILQGANGCGKSTLIQTLLHHLKKAPAQTSTPPGLPKTPPGRQKPLLPQNPAPTPSNPATPTPPTEWGTLRTAASLIVSYVSQDTSFLQGKLKTFSNQHNLPEPLFYALLRQLDLEREQFQKPMEEFSEGQKKKVLIAASLLTPAHLYIWDEPLNYIDIFSRMQIETLIQTYRPTMLIVEHDQRFAQTIATKILKL